MIDSRDFLQARRRAEIEVLLPKGAKNAFAGGVECNDHHRIADAFEKGGGIKFEDYGQQCVHALDLINSGQSGQRLASYWLPQMPEVAERISLVAACWTSAAASVERPRALRRRFRRPPWWRLTRTRNR